MKVARPLVRLIESFHKLPGIGPKTAQRLSYYLLHVPQSELDEFGNAIVTLKKNTVLCSVCRNVAEEDPCPICTDSSRDSSTILIVEQPLDILAIERTNKYRGLYHVLHGAINPLENIGPDEIYVKELFKRIDDDAKGVLEVIVATNPTMEGDATAMFIAKQLKQKTSNGKKLSITRLGMGIPTGADIEYADDNTITQAIEGRRPI